MARRTLGGEAGGLSPSAHGPEVMRTLCVVYEGRQEKLGYDCCNCVRHRFPDVFTNLFPTWSLTSKDAQVSLQCTGVSHLQENVPPYNPTADLCLEPYGGPREVGVFL